MTSITRTLQRGLLVLEAIAANGGSEGLTITELAETVSIDKATASRLTNTLRIMGYVHQDGQSKRYMIAGKLLGLASGYISNLDLPQRAAPYLARLRDQADETVHLGVRDGNQIVYISKLESKNPVQIASAVGQSMPMHTTALGKAILAASDPEGWAVEIQLLDLTPRTDRSVRSEADLERELQRTRDRGYSIDDRENEDSITCVGSAIVNTAGHILGAISVSGPSYRVSDRLDEIGELCLSTAHQIEASL